MNNNGVVKPIVNLVAGEEMETVGKKIWKFRIPADIL